METGQICLHSLFGKHCRHARRVWLVAVLVLVFAALLDQQRARAQSLDDLIPAQAVENPEEWANQTSSPVLDNDARLPGDAEVDATLEPDHEGGDIDLLPLESVALEEDPPDASPERLEFTDFGVAEPVSAVDLESVRITDGLELGLPFDPEEFGEGEEFVARFSALSTLRGLGSAETNVAQVAVRVTNDEALLADLLRLYGYYDGRVIPAISARNASSQNGGASVRFNIQPGRQFTIGTVDLGQLSEAGADLDLLRNAFAIQSGDTARTDLIVEERLALVTALGENGYTFASVDEPRLTVDHLRFEADLDMAVSPNGKYRIGEVVSGAPDLMSSQHLSSLARFDPGEIYQESEVQDLRQVILGTGLVSRISITPRQVAPPEGTEPGTVDLDVAMDQAPLRTIKAGIGYGTGEGYKLSGSWEHRNLFPPEGMLLVRGLLGTREILAGLTFQRNNLGGRHRVLTADTSIGQEDRDAYHARTVRLVASYELKSTPLHRYRFTWGLGTELLATDEREILVTGERSDRQTYLVGAFPLHAQLDTSDDLLDPKEGFRLGLRLSPELSIQGKDATSYVRARWDGSVYRRVGGGTVLAARTALGSIFGAQIGDIAPSRRFYAGGGGSVRGFGFEAIGTRDDPDGVSGGRSLAEFSLEARIPTNMFNGAVSVVPFVDAGAVYEDKIPAFENMRFGAGLGFRYDTPIGPFRVDIATPINPRQGDRNVVVYVSLGQAF
jgi:translocation and assembly module TamA